MVAIIFKSSILAFKANFEEATSELSRGAKILAKIVLLCIVLASIALFIAIITGNAPSSFSY
jgi:hypothetical protein